MRSIKFFLFLIICYLFSPLTWADGAGDFTPPNAAPPSPTDKLTFDGYISGSYNYLLRKNYFTSGILNRVYDINENGLTLQQIYLTASKQPEEGFGAYLNLLLGSDALISAPYGFNPSTGIHRFGWDLQEVYVQYAKKPITFSGGIYQSLAGVEPIDMRQMMSFSYGILSTYAVPGFVMGLRSVTKVDKDFTLTLGVNNGWDVIRDTGREKTIEVGIIDKVNSHLTFSIQDYNGQQRALDFTAKGPLGRRNVIDAVATIIVTPKFNIVLNGDYGVQSTAALPIPEVQEELSTNELPPDTMIVEDEGEESSAEDNLNNIIKEFPALVVAPTFSNGDDQIAIDEDVVFGHAIWKGLALYLNYKFNDKWRVSLRGEDFDDQDGYRTGVAQNWNEVTLAVGYNILKNLEFCFETRRDFSNVNSFVNKDRVTTSNNQQSYAVEAIYSLF
jgi:hypothetical protein